MKIDWNKPLHRIAIIWLFAILYPNLLAIGVFWAFGISSLSIFFLIFGRPLEGLAAILVYVVPGIIALRYLPLKGPYPNHKLIQICFWYVVLVGFMVPIIGDGIGCGRWGSCGVP